MRNKRDVTLNLSNSLKLLPLRKPISEKLFIEIPLNDI